MELAEALRRCCIMSKVNVAPNAEGEVDLLLHLTIDPTTEEGVTIIDWYNEFGPLERIEVSSEPRRGLSIEEALSRLTASIA